MFKNYKAHEKDLVVKQMAKEVASGQVLACLGWGPVKDSATKIHRIRRHLKTRSRSAQGHDDQSLDIGPTQLGSLGNVITPESLGYPSSPADNGSLLACYGLTLPPRGTYTYARPCSNMVGCPVLPAPLLCTTSTERILQITRAYITGLIETPRMFPHSSQHVTRYNIQLGSVSHRDVLAFQTGRFWHDLETAIYLLHIGSTELGWSTFQTTWEQAANIILAQPATLLRKLGTTLSPTGRLKIFPHALALIWRFIKNLIGKKLGNRHPLYLICRESSQDNNSSHTTEQTLRLTRDMFQRSFGLAHYETFETALTLVAWQRITGSLAAAEHSALTLVADARSTEPGLGLLPQALRRLSHIQKAQHRYEESISTCHELLEEGVRDAPSQMNMYTEEDLADLYRLQGNLFMESHYLINAANIAHEVFPAGAAPTLHILDKLKDSLAAQGRVEEQALWEETREISTVVELI